VFITKEENDFLRFTIPMQQITAQATEYVHQLDALDAPRDAGRPAAIKALKDAGHKINTNYVSEVVRWRRTHLSDSRTVNRTAQKQGVGQVPRTATSEKGDSVDATRLGQPSRTVSDSPVEPNRTVPSLLETDSPAGQCFICGNEYAPGAVCMTKGCCFQHWSHVDIVKRIEQDAS
jgi:hypothetical protein